MLVHFSASIVAKMSVVFQGKILERIPRSQRDCGEDLRPHRGHLRRVRRRPLLPVQELREPGQPRNAMDRPSDRHHRQHLRCGRRRRLVQEAAMSCSASLRSGFNYSDW